MFVPVLVVSRRTKRPMRLLFLLSHTYIFNAKDLSIRNAITGS
jgi:hypothetical protein